MGVYENLLSGKDNVRRIKDVNLANYLMAKRIKDNAKVAEA